MDEWNRFTELNTRLAGPIDDYVVPAHWTRKQLRSMGRVSRFSVGAAEMALADAGLLGNDIIRDGRMGVACGSSTGSTDEIKAFGMMLINSVAEGLNANSYVRMMPHTTAANISIFFGLTGRLIPTSSACTSGSQGIGYAYEAIKFGRLPMMLAGGAEELCPTEAMVFDALYATSLKNDAPHTSPRPYDSGRDGLVIGEDTLWPVARISTRKLSVSAAMPTASMRPARNRRPCAEPWNWHSRTRAWRPRPSAM